MTNSYLEIRKDHNEFPLDCFVNSGDLTMFPHWHKEIEVIYVRKGRLNVGINDSIITLHEGEIQIINGGEVHYFLLSPGSERIVLLFDTSFFKDMRLINQNEFSLVEIMKNIEKSSQNWPNSITSRIQELILNIYHELEAKNQGYLFALKAMMYEMISIWYRFLFKTHPSSPSNEKPVHQKSIVDNLSKIFSYVEGNFQNKITIEEIAQHIGFNSQYFTRYFKKLTGHTFVTFLNDYRLSKAMWLLLNEDLPIIEVASQAGFSSVKTFHHLFKKKYGTSPLKYKKSKS